nr:uncharacterized protein LOC125180100 [Anser cygnoides]XP_047904254.1 uncharacterized protein LOC125180100 [Anser cygnoides]
MTVTFLACLCLALFVTSWRSWMDQTGSIRVGTQCAQSARDVGGIPKHARSHGVCSRHPAADLPAAAFHTLAGSAGRRIVCFSFLFFSSGSQNYPNQMGIGFPCRMRGTPRPVAPRSPPHPKKAESRGSTAAPPGGAGEKGKRSGVVVQFSPLQQLGQGRVPRVFPRKEVRAGQPPAPGGPTSSQPPTPRSCPYKAAVVTEARKKKKKKKKCNKPKSHKKLRERYLPRSGLPPQAGSRCQPSSASGLPPQRLRLRALQIYEASALRRLHLLYVVLQEEVRISDRLLFFAAFAGCETVVGLHPAGEGARRGRLWGEPSNGHLPPPFKKMI